METESARSVGVAARLTSIHLAGLTAVDAVTRNQTTGNLVRSASQLYVRSCGEQSFAHGGAGSAAC